MRSQMRLRLWLKSRRSMRLCAGYSGRRMMSVSLSVFPFFLCYTPHCMTHRYRIYHEFFEASRSLEQCKDSARHARDVRSLEWVE